MSIASNPMFFIKIIGGKLILWDYRKHSQYEITANHIRRLLEISRGDDLTESGLDAEIAASGILADDDRKLEDWGWDCLSQIFHIGTQIVLEDGVDLPSDDGYEGYVAYCASIVENIPTIKYIRAGVPIELPVPSKDFADVPRLADALLKRQTTRSFIPEHVELQKVADTLHWTFGAVHGETREDMRTAGLLPIGYRRTSPSGGSLHPSEAYLVALRVTGLRAGIYHYRAMSHQLTLVTEKIDGELLGRILCAQMFARNLAFGVFVTSRFDKMWWKYPHSRAYRVALLDIGCLAQTFQLSTTGLGLQSWLTGYFLDREINRLLAVDEVNESVLFFMGAGHGEGSAFAPELLSAVEKCKKYLTKEM
ncbi:SagB family peptide dehydrogenase [Burkholderia sp. 567]|uniref:SagB family peptide dehydrogenase n=1 Tax=Burkholderia sp. 567 TaxID=3156413 RepID=UPI00339B4BC2